MADIAPRFRRLSPDTLTAAQQPIVDRLKKSLLPGRDGLGGPFDIMLLSPGMANGMVDLFEYYRFHTKLPARLKEFAILILAREWTAQFEWFAHKPAAEKAGLPAAVIADLRLGKRPAAMRPDEVAIYDLATALIRDHAAGDAAFDRARGLLGDEQLVDLISLIGEYMKVALLLNAGRVGVPDGNELPLPPLGAKS
jgi:4-carboxymuconolactone decarboxylase